MIYLFNTNIQIYPAGLQTYVCIVHDDTVQCKAIRSTIINLRYIELSIYIIHVNKLVKMFTAKIISFVFIWENKVNK